MSRSTRILTRGVHFGEGPRWRDGRLWFSDVASREVKSVSPTGDLRVEFTLDDQPSGLGWTPDGDLLVVSMTKRQLLRRAPDGTMQLHADLSALAPWHLNDMVVDAQGRAYVGNFGFDMEKEVRARGIESVLADNPTTNLICVEPDGTVREAAADLDFPNGTVITADGMTLIISESFAGLLTAFDVSPEGDLSNRRVWASLPTRMPDGICLDEEGAIWVTDPPAHECVRVAEGGQVLEVIDTGIPCYACMLGGDDGRSLFILTSPNFDIPELRNSEPPGFVLVAEVDVPRAGYP